MSCYDLLYRARLWSFAMATELRTTLIAHYLQVGPILAWHRPADPTTTTRRPTSCGRERLTSPLTVRNNLRKRKSAQR